MRHWRSWSSALTSFARQSLLQDHNGVLLTANKKTKKIRAQKSVYLKNGEGKVFEYEDLEESRIQRNAKEKAAAKKCTGTHGRKRKATIPEDQEKGPLPVRKGKAARRTLRSENQEPIPWMAPEAQMY
jgi:hypothetical protein